MFLSRNFLTAKRRRGDFGQQSIAHCKDSQTKIRKSSSRVMAGLVPAIHVFCFAAS
jgi:hypothetical protein